jgi:HlyD family secretion protein
MKTILAILVIIGLAIGGAVYYTTRVAADPTTSFRTAAVKRGDLASTISATGTVEAEEFVDVGAQCVGPVKEFGVDPADQAKFKAKFKAEKQRDPTSEEMKEAEKTLKRIDYGSTVEENTVLARIDDSVYRAQLDQARSSLVRAKADLLQMKAKLAQSEQDWKRAQRLRPDRAAAENKASQEKKVAANTPAADAKSAADIKTVAESKTAADDKISLDYRAMSDSDYDLAKANYEVALANVAVGEAGITQAEAALRLAQTNLDYTIIKSPVRGVIVDRRVNVGQTVVATFSAASLFLIAKDLRRVQVWASVNEADIGRIHVGLPVRFTIDAFSGEVFRGKVAQIRLNAQMNQNVVTYTVVVETDNSSLKLLPYLTANLQFEIDQRKDVLLVPNAALRWKPRPEQVVPAARASVSLGGFGKAGGPWSKGGEGTRGGGEGGKGSGAWKQGGGDAAKSDGQWKKRGDAAKGEIAGGSGAAKSAPSAETGSARPQAAREERGRVWIQDGDLVRPIEVQIGTTDGSQTEISGSEVKEGTEVVIGEARKQDLADSDTTNPFMPKLFKGGKKI